MPDAPAIIYASWQEYTNALRLAWAKLPGLAAVRIVRAKDNRPVVLVIGAAARPPIGLPAVLRAAVGTHRFTLSVLWQQYAPVEKPVAAPTAAQNKPLSRSMWDGAPPVRDRFMPELEIDPHAPIIPMARAAPAAPCNEFQCFIPARDPEIPFWSRAYDDRACVCCGNFGVDNPVITFPVPSDQMLTVRTIAYWAYGVNVGDRLRIRVARSGSQQATWDDQVMSLASDANQFAFTGTVQPMPLNVIIDHDQTFTVSVTPLGPPPYNYDPTIASGVQVCVLVGGWVSTLNDRREGAPKSYDLGDITEGAFGDLDVVGDFHDAALARAVKQLINEGACPGSLP